MWFLFALLGYVCAAVVTVLDKILLTKSSLRAPIVYTFYSTIIFLFLFAAPVLGVPLLAQADWPMAIISGLFFGLGTWALCIAIKESETSHVIPFGGSVLTIFILILSYIFFHEQLVWVQYVGIAVLIVGSFFLSFEKTKNYTGIHRGYLWISASALCFAIAHITTKYLYMHYPFVQALVWSKAPAGLIGLLTLCSPAVWKSFQKKRKKKSARQHTTVLFISNKGIVIMGNLLLQYAMAIGSVTLVNALIGTEFVFLFLLVYFFTRFRPQVFKEYFADGEVRMELIALVFVVAGSVLVVL